MRTRVFLHDNILMNMFVIFEVYLQAHSSLS